MQQYHKGWIEHADEGICNFTYCNVWDLITYQFLSVNGYTVEVGEWLFHPKLYWACDYLSMLGLNLIKFSIKGTHFDNIFHPAGGG